MAMSIYGPRYSDREIQGYNWDLAASELGSVTGYGQEKAVPIQLVKVDPSPQLVTDADGQHIGVVWSDQPGYYIQSEDGRYLTISMEKEYISRKWRVSDVYWQSEKHPFSKYYWQTTVFHVQESIHPRAAALESHVHNPRRFDYYSGKEIIYSVDKTEDTSDLSSANSSWRSNLEIDSKLWLEKKMNRGCGRSCCDFMAVVPCTVVHLGCGDESGWIVVEYNRTYEQSQYGWRGLDAFDFEHCRYEWIPLESTDIFPEDADRWWTYEVDTCLSLLNYESYECINYDDDFYPDTRGFELVGSVVHNDDINEWHRNRRSRRKMWKKRRRQRMKAEKAKDEERVYGNISKRRLRRRARKSKLNLESDFYNFI